MAHDDPSGIMGLMESKIDELNEALSKARRVLVFTGAGASKESGLPTFREIDGEWSKHDPMTFATLEDDSGLLNIALKPPVYEKFKELLATECFLIVKGRLQKDHNSVSLLVQQIKSIENDLKPATKALAPIRYFF